MRRFFLLSIFVLFFLPTLSAVAIDFEVPLETPATTESLPTQTITASPENTSTTTPTQTLSEDEQKKILVQELLDTVTESEGIVDTEKSSTTNTSISTTTATTSDSDFQTETEQKASIVEALLEIPTESLGIAEEKDATSTAATTTAPLVEPLVPPTTVHEGFGFSVTGTPSLSVLPQDVGNGAEVVVEGKSGFSVAIFGKTDERFRMDIALGDGPQVFPKNMFPKGSYRLFFLADGQVCATLDECTALDQEHVDFGVLE